MFSLHKSRRILKQGMTVLKKKGASLVETQRKGFEADLRALDQAVLSKDKRQADGLAKKVALFVKEHFPKNFFDHTKEIVFALVFALAIAFVIRSIWFELYEVPTGSMRPTVEEKDRLVVSKSTFGVHLPLINHLFFFKPEYLKRGGPVVFTALDLDVADANMLYFYLFPGKKRFIKRAIGKGGDTLYFYGGRIYGVDASGAPIEELYDENLLKQMGLNQIDHIPYITQEGKVTARDLLPQGVYREVVLHQMNEPIGKLTLTKNRAIEGEFFDGKIWVKDDPNALKKPRSSPKSYSDLWGIGNFAMARLLNKEELKSFYPQALLPQKEDLLFLELHHTPNLNYPKAQVRRGTSGRILPTLSPMTTIIPLQKRHLEAMRHALYTARFCVQDGRAWRYHESGKRVQSPHFDIKLPHVPDGCYEFYYGQGYSVHVGGILKKLPLNHPLYASEPEQIQKLFNLGISFNQLFRPQAPEQPFAPQRFAYYREGDLYLMGAPIFKKQDPTLAAFVAQELQKQQSSPPERPYIAFVDPGPPIKEGTLDTEFIKAFGMKIPDDHFLALGDNFAMSADSRDFGFVPTQNLRGSPLFIFWPPGKRLGALPGAAYPIFTLPNILVWGSALIVIIIIILWLRKRNKRSLFKD